MSWITKDILEEIKDAIYRILDYSGHENFNIKIMPVSNAVYSGPYHYVLSLIYNRNEVSQSIVYDHLGEEDLIHIFIDTFANMGFFKTIEALTKVSEDDILENWLDLDENILRFFVNEKRTVGYDRLRLYLKLK